MFRTICVVAISLVQIMLFQHGVAAIEYNQPSPVHMAVESSSNLALSCSVADTSCVPSLTVGQSRDNISQSSSSPNLIPLHVLFDNSMYGCVRMSPDGRYMSYIATDEASIMQIWRYDIQRGERQQLSHFQESRLSGENFNYKWTHDSQYILFMSYVNGTDALSALSEDGQEILLYNCDRGCRIVDFFLSPSYLRDVVINEMDRAGYSMAIRASFDKGNNDTVISSESIPRGSPFWLVDDQLVVRAVFINSGRGSYQLFTRNNSGETFRSLSLLKVGRLFQPLFLSSKGDQLYYISDEQSDTSQLYALDMKTGMIRALSQGVKYDLEQVLHVNNNVIAYSTYADKRIWVATDDRAKLVFDHLRRFSNADFTVLSVSKDYRDWLVTFTADNNPTQYYLYNAQTHKCRELFKSRPGLETAALATTRPISLEARDGVQLHGYLTMPFQAVEHHLPMVVLVHGGPNERDYWHFNPTVQWLANRGYVVLQINFRGSSGYGRQFLELGEGEWGGRMQDDLTDGVRWAIQQKIADPKRIAIMGMSYGGYAAITGLAFSPDLYACGIAFAAPTDLQTMYEFMQVNNSVLSGLTGDGEQLRARSPINAIDRISAPLLLGHGNLDRRVPVSQYQKFVETTLKSGSDFECVLYPDEGHVLDSLKNRLDFYSRAERFLNKHLVQSCETSHRK